MPIYEYICPVCRNTFELRRPFSECDAVTECPTCKAECDRIISAFSHVTATPADHYLHAKDKAAEKMWLSERKIEDDKIKNPDPLAKWREERQQACGKGPEAWVEWAKEEVARKEKEADEERTKETAVRDYANWAAKSTSADPKEREMYKAAIEQEKMAAAFDPEERKRKWNPVTEVWEDDKPEFDYPPVFKPKGEKKESRFERRKPEITENEDEIPEDEQYL
ncbi:MAG: zinc ribbon domain-containing protein [Dehalogenimonas sp.]|uniref:Zinc ribbon domain-containing protein n=1 Tax=Candidatus Dehalogenimonas loeffleri TaxID=3127115 RepID=A0ABZ2J995_9CHLR|nr:zinc ribbon domain-containing protein [Dehalogenimonas sp.]